MDHDLRESDDRGAYARFLETRADYTDRERAASENADRVIIGGAAAALGLSVTFVEKIAGHAIAASRPILGWAWLLLLASLASSLLAHVYRSQAYQEMREDLDRTVRSGELDLSRIDLSSMVRKNRFLHRVLIFRVITLVVGVAFIVLFAYTNVSYIRP